MDYSRYWRDCVENNIARINKRLGTNLATPETEEGARDLYHRWLHNLALTGEDL